MEPVGVILAAGRSRRFGAADKLRAELAGRPLITHAARAMAALPLRARALVCRPDLAALCPGFTALSVPEGADQSASLAAASRFAQAKGASHLLIALGDMPWITGADLGAILARGAKGPAAAHNGAHPLPPVCFPAALFADLAGLRGDQGARPLLRALPPSQLVPLPTAHLRDIDHQADLAAAQSEAPPPGP